MILGYTPIPMKGSENKNSGLEQGLCGQRSARSNLLMVTLLSA